MSVIRTDELEYSDDVAKATRVINVDGGGGVIPTPPAAAVRVTSIQRLTTAVTTAITAGKQSYSVTVVTAASAASPTLDGVALPAGYTATFSITNPGDTLEAASLATVVGDDVLLITVT